MLPGGLPGAEARRDITHLQRKQWRHRQGREVDGDHRRHDHLQGHPAESISGAGGLSRGADPQKEGLALRHGAEIREKQPDEGQCFAIRPQLPRAVFQALQEGDTGKNRPALSCGRAGDDMGTGTAAVCGLSLRLAHGFGRQKEFPQRRRRHLRLHHHHELLHSLQSRHILPRDRGDGGKPDPAGLPQAAVCGLQQAALEEADVQGVCTSEKRLR